MTDFVVRVVDVTKTHGTGPQAMKALNGITLDVARGEFVSLMGPSGSGKTTLLNLIAGIDEPTSGYVIVDGVRLSNLADHELADMRLKTVGFVFQTFNLIPALSVEENVSWPLQFAGHSRRDARRRTAESLRRVGVVDRGRRRPAELSGGEQQRVAIARAIATRPRIILADEPTGNLDSHSGRSILDLLRTLNKSDDVTVIMVTHNVFAATYGDRTLELRDGRIASDVRTPAGDVGAASPGASEA